MELGGKVTIDCEKTNHRAELEFKLKVRDIVGPILNGSQACPWAPGKVWPYTPARLCSSNVCMHHRVPYLERRHHPAVGFAQCNWIWTQEAWVLHMTSLLSASWVLAKLCSECLAMTVWLLFRTVQLFLSIFAKYSEVYKLLWGKLGCGSSVQLSGSHHIHTLTLQVSQWDVPCVPQGYRTLPWW